MKLRICIVGLISLFAWNAVFGAFGGLLLCIHQDLGVHLDDAKSCSSAHEAPTEGAGCVEIDESCVDVELVAELLPAARTKSETGVNQQQVIDLLLVDRLRVPEASFTHIFESVAPRAPPHVCWLTDFYLQTTVIQI